MEKKEIIINVAGQAGVGKSRITYIIKEILRVHGLEVEFDPGADYQNNESVFNRHMRKDFDEAMEGFKDTRKVIIKEVQLPR